MRIKLLLLMTIIVICVKGQNTDSDLEQVRIMSAKMRNKQYIGCVRELNKAYL